jgi:hypothetical protein
MLRPSVVLWFVLLVFATCNSGFCENVPSCYQSSFAPAQPCATSQPAPPPPITRTVQVDVPVPCPRPLCAPQACPPSPCGPTACPPACPTQPVQVRIDVRVRPEPCGAQRPDQNVCLDFGPLGPVIGIAAATMAIPIRLLETLFPGPGWRRLPQAVCGPYGAPPYSPCVPSMPIPAYQKCVPLPTCGPPIQPVYLQRPQAAACSPGSGQHRPLLRPTTDLGNGAVSGGLSSRPVSRGGMGQ